MEIIPHRGDTLLDLLLHFTGVYFLKGLKLKSVNALSSTEEYPIASVTVSKTAIFLRSMLQELGFLQESLTPIYKENDHTTDIVRSSIPTERT